MSAFKRLWKFKITVTKEQKLWLLKALKAPDKKVGQVVMFYNKDIPEHHEAPWRLKKGFAFNHAWKGLELTLESNAEYDCYDAIRLVQDLWSKFNVEERMFVESIGYDEKTKLVTGRVIVFSKDKSVEVGTYDMQSKINALWDKDPNKIELTLHKHSV